MKPLNQYINESILDDEDDLIRDFDKHLAKNWVEDNCTGTYKVIYLKDGTLKLSSGKLIIKGYKEDSFPPYINFSAINGDIVIEKCPNIYSIEGLIKDPEFMTMKGSLSIGNCPKFNTLKGFPHILDGSMTLVGNQSLKSLEDAPEMVFGNVTMMKNGKKFKEEAISRYIKYSRRIDCSLEDESILESLVNEALNEPHLLKLAKVLREKEGSFADNINKWMGNIAYDEIDASNVDIYNTADKTQKTRGLSAVRNLCADKYTGMIIGVTNGEYKCVLLPNKRILYINKYISLKQHQTTDIVLYFEMCDEIVVINIPNDLSTTSKIRDRHISRQGMIKPGDEHQYREIARENLKRYKEIIAKNKASKDKTYEKISAMVEKTLQRYVKATMQLHKNPDKYADSIFILSALNDAISGRQQYSAGKISGSDGIMVYYEHFNEAYAKIYRINNNSYITVNKDHYLQVMKDYADAIERKINHLESYFQRFGV